MIMRMDKLDTLRAKLQSRLTDERYSFDAPAGWADLIDGLDSELSRIDPDYKIVQMKEKFGGLRFYTTPLSKPGYELVAQAEEQSYTICQTCGEPGTLDVVSWLYGTWCEDCKPKR